MRSKKSALAFIAVGILLIAIALSICIYNYCMDSRALSASSEVLDELEEIIEENFYDDDNAEDVPDDSQLPDTAGDDAEADSCPAVEIDGNYYIGILTIPTLELQLPVMKEWSYVNLNIAPCRYYGYPDDHNLVIAAHNYRAFFKNLNTLNSGDELIFTSVDGHTREYVVSYMEIVNGYAPDYMICESDDWDMTLFTCTWSGRSRVTVRAEEVKFY